MSKTCYVHLGRYGDEIILLPGWKQVYDQTGHRPVVMVAKAFAGIFDGVSYVRPWMVNHDWVKGVHAAIQEARRSFSIVIVPKFWDDPKATSPWTGEGGIEVEMLGRKFHVKHQPYHAGEWENAGFDIQDIMLPPLFDRRDLAREKMLWERVTAGLLKKLPIILFNFSGVSNAFPFEPEFAQAIRPLRTRFNLLNLANVTAHRIYDLLGIYDRAAGLITGDTATLHLAGASKVPYIAFLAGGFGSSIPKGNCQHRINYGDFCQRKLEILPIIESWLTNHKPAA